MADSNQASQAFLAWFKDRQTSYSPKIRLADLSQHGKGRGVVALQDIDEDEVLFSISRKDILSAETSGLLDHDQGKQISADLDDQWLSLDLVLIHEYLSSQSAWKPYLDVLPASFDTLMFWTDAELAQLQASAVKDKIGKRSADELFTTKLIPAVRSAPHLFPGSEGMSDDHLLQLAHRMGSVIMAYAFDIEKRPSTQDQDEEGYISEEENDFLPKGMVPMADMLNADADFNNARLFYEEDKVVMCTIKPVKAGEELFNDYGSLPRADLLRRYGYITDNYAKYDVVELTSEFVVSTVQGIKSEEERAGFTEEYMSDLAEALEEKGYYEDAYDIGLLRDDDEDEEDFNPLFPPGLQMLLYRLTVDNNKSRPAPAKYAKKPQNIDAEEWVDIYETYLVTAQRRLDQYPTSAEQDENMLRALTAGQSVTREAMAVRVRLGEKHILLKAIDFARTELASAAATNGEARPQKRARTTR